MEHNEISCEKLLKKIESNCLKAKDKIKLIESYNKTDCDKKIDFSFLVEEEADEEIINDGSDDEFSKFESFVSLYLSDILKLSGNIELEDIINILPPKSNGYFKDLVYRLQAELLKEISDFSSFDISDLSKEDLEDCLELINTNKKKISLLKEALNYEDKNNIEEECSLNKLVLVPTASGNIRILDDLKKIPSESYSAILDLIKTIEKGEFQGLKKLTNNGNVESIYEVKGITARVLFSRISSNHYALITCFLKKVTFDNYYNSVITNASNLFKRNQEFLKENLSNKEFMKENDLNIEEMYRILGDDTLNKEYTKGDING